MSHLELFHGLVAAGVKMRYGNKPGKNVLLRVLWEKKHIIDAGYVDYYIMACWMYRHYAMSAEINVWACGAVPSSVVCYCLGLTEVDPVKYGLHSARFVNDELPKFRFDIEASRFDEFKNGAKELLQANAGEFDIPAITACLLREDVKVGERISIKYLWSCAFLSRKNERPVPDNLDDELTRYALYMRDTMDLYEAYVNNPSTFDGLIYQEQMMDILRNTFHVRGIKANQIRLAIQRGEADQVEAYRRELFASLKDITSDEAESSWKRLTSNPHAFLKAHAVSRILAGYYYDFPQLIY